MFFWGVCLLPLGGGLFVCSFLGGRGLMGEVGCFCLNLFEGSGLEGGLDGFIFFQHGFLCLGAAWMVFDVFSCG